MINGSPRSGGSCAEILDAISENCSKYGYECEKIDLGNLKISHCVGCMSCKKTGKCAINDDMTPLYSKVQDADALVLSFPIYFGLESGLFKNFLDRLYALLDRNGNEWSARFGKPKKGIVAISCGAPDGNMIYHGTATHIVISLKMFGVTDVSSSIIPKVAPGTVKDSPFMKDLLGAIDFQMS
jgi:multimeric flavodoxin WrbA